MKFARFEVERPPGPDTVTLRAKLRGAQGFAKQVELLVLSASAPREALDRFLQGGARLAELADGNLLQVLEVGYEDGRAFLATEASAGESLSKLLEQCKERGLDALPAALAFGIGAELAKALAHAHAHVDAENQPDPVTHGALRSEAVTVGEDGAVKLGGFVPWRAAPNPADDVEKLVELVGQWVSQPDKKLVRESAGGVVAAAELRKAWSAYQALHWPLLAPDARRTLVAFARGQATKQSLESKLGARPAPAPVPKWAFAIAGAAVALVAVALLWPSSEPARIEEVALPPPAKLPKNVAPKDEGFSETVVVDGSEHQLELPGGLPSVEYQGELWFREETAPDPRAPQLYVVSGAGDVGTVPRWWWHLRQSPLKFFSWEPFKPRFRPGLRSVALYSEPLSYLPLVQPWLEVEGEGLHRHVPTNKQLTLAVSAAAGAGVPQRPLLVAISYGFDPRADHDPRWPFQLTRLALSAGEKSPVIEDAQELAFIALGAADRFEVRITEGSTTRDGLWPGAVERTKMNLALVNKGRRTFDGHFEGWELPQAVVSASSHNHPGNCPPLCQQCVSSWPDDYHCWRLLTEESRPGPEAVAAAKGFLNALGKAKLEHPLRAHAMQVAGVTSPAAEETAPPAPGSPEKR